MGQHVFSRHVTSGWHHGSSVTNLTSLVASVWFFHFQGPLTFDLCDWEVIGELVLLNSHLLPGSWPVLWPSSQDSWLNQLSLLLVKCWLIIFLLPSTCYLLTSHGKISYPFSPSSFLKVDSQCVVWGFIQCNISHFCHLCLSATSRGQKSTFSTCSTTHRQSFEVCRLNTAPHCLPLHFPSGRWGWAYFHVFQPFFTL